ncbi:Vitamin K-dependent gamma-carboxylase [Halobacillus dabanensis]|uniref:Vitamin K-dependent gamma-carboxylase n=1 Tax=Halobacillus dabanensis TaxID=240302 RepID=A0A1I3S6G9_HALDA|nr:HTTM domain-containing protein [Halobacillus dabanensis]SFJ53980.1 Vitamin K-dependent gamma-carboxylase [Halobacillus dabanensis]
MKQFFDKLTNKKHMLIGTSILRISFGLLILYMYLIHYAQRRFLWGPNGMQSHDSLRDQMTLTSNFSLYQLSDSMVYFEVIFHLGILFALLFTVGFMNRTVAVLNFLFLWSLQHANVLILDGGDNIMRIILLYLIFANTASHFSIDRTRKIGKASTPKPLSNALHNLAVLASILQLCLMYLSSGLHKVMGEMWTNGTALYYILQVGEYTHPFFQTIISSSEIILMIGAYSAIFIQLSFPFLLLNRYTKYLAMFNIVALHIGIAVVMGLFTFSAAMITMQLLMLTDREYQKVFAYVSKSAAKFRDKFQNTKVKNYETKQVQ